MLNINAIQETYISIKINGSISCLSIIALIIEGFTVKWLNIHNLRFLRGAEINKTKEAIEWNAKT
jgi:hypothetical protein